MLSYKEYIKRLSHAQAVLNLTMHRDPKADWEIADNKYYAECIKEIELLKSQQENAVLNYCCQKIISAIGTVPYNKKLEISWYKVYQLSGMAETKEKDRKILVASELYKEFWTADFYYCE